jgi:hypothetical protein
MENLREEKKKTEERLQRMEEEQQKQKERLVIEAAKQSAVSLTDSLQWISPLALAINGFLLQ